MRCTGEAVRKCRLVFVLRRVNHGRLLCTLRGLFEGCMRWHSGRGTGGHVAATPYCAVRDDNCA